jgi:hypothetical protein
MPSPLPTTQLTEMFDRDTANVTVHLYLAWRALHSQGRGLNSVMMTQLGDDLDRYDLREGELFANALVGWNFGDGHLHGPALVAAVQERCRFEPGELIVVCAESEPIARGSQQYQVIDAAVGVVERGTWVVRDAVEEQPWLANGPIPLAITERRAGYVRRSHSADQVGIRPTAAA